MIRGRRVLQVRASRGVNSIVCQQQKAVREMSSTLVSKAGPSDHDCTQDNAEKVGRW